jgi:hypothetical protein
MNRTLYTKTEMQILRAIMTKANKRERIFIWKRENNIYVSFNGACEIKACYEKEFPYNIESEMFERPKTDPLEKILNEKISNEMDVYFSTPDKNGICKILPNPAGIEKIGIDGKKSAFLGKDCRFKLFVSGNCIYIGVYAADEFIGVFCPVNLAGREFNLEVEKLLKYFETVKKQEA